MEIILMNKIFAVFITISILSSCSEINIPVAGKIVQLSCECNQEFNKSLNKTQECFWDEKEWAVSTITKSFYHDGNAITGSQKTGEFSETNNYYKVVVPEKEYATYLAGEETITLNRNTLDLKHETYGYIFNYSCAMKGSQQI